MICRCVNVNVDVNVISFTYRVVVIWCKIYGSWKPFKSDGKYNNFTLNVLKIFLSWPFGHVEKWHYEKDEVGFKIYDVLTYVSCISAANFQFIIENNVFLKVH